MLKRLSLNKPWQIVRPYLQPAQQRWQQLGTREQRLLGFAGIVILSLLLYYFLVDPLLIKVEKLHQDINTQTELLQWMQPRVAHLKGQKTSGAPKIAASALLQTVDSESKRSPFASQISELSQTSDKGVQMTLTKVPFDRLLTWLVKQWQSKGIEVSRFSAQRTKPVGTARVVLTVKVRN